jgi:hypothetical protein
MAEKRSSSVSPNVSPSMIIPKREPIENDFIQNNNNNNNKRRFGEHLTHDTDPIVLNKRQMATKKHQHSDNISTKLINGRNGNNDEQQQQKQTESHLSLNNQKMFSNSGNIDLPSSSSNVHSKPR